MWSSPSHTGQERGRLWSILVLLSCYVGLSVQQRDPIKNFCRRWGHQSAVVDDKLYIDGGLITYSGDSKHENVTNTYLIYHDLSSVADSGMPQPYANLSKNGTIPSVNGGIFWPDTVNKRIYLFGGEYYDQTPWSFNLYGYDVLNDNWDNYGSPRNLDINGLSYGAGLSISERGEGYYYGGWMNSNTDSNWQGDGILTSYMLVYSMDDNSWSNNTGPDTVGRAEGVMLYIPAGDGGMLVYFGGIRGTGNGTWEGQPMDEIIVYDVLSGKSYTQNATGDVPDMRRRFCAGVTWVEDQSSYNIYLYGGLGEANGSSGFDDIYILTLPTFTWIRMFPTDSKKTGPYPHHSLSCNVINSAQMIIHGGFFPLSNDCDSPDQWGLHNLDMGEQNKDKAIWALYDPTKTKYVLPTNVLSVVGGKSTGGATNTKPAKGWDHDDLRVLMTRQASVSVRTATRDVGDATSTSTSTSTGEPHSHKGLSTGAIVGIAVGGAAGVALILIGIWCLCRRRNNDRASTNVSSQQPMNQTYDYHPPHSSSILSPGPWSPGSSQFVSTTPPTFNSSSPQTVVSHVNTGPPIELPTESNTGPISSPYPETPGEPKYDQHGNLWVPQVAVMESRSPDGTATYQSQASTAKYSPTPTPQELATEAERNAQNTDNVTHQTYYHP
ncbi:hypothetical protein BGZ63DRAFT_111118 [Mariannaea sp. PMI_226]|nr:hypothetical protein BGZ63DRAFT_111118 [Mariannaea sp. PMI_226]